MRSGLIALVIALWSVPAGAAQAPLQRDAESRPTVGTGSISGVVVTDETPPQPVRRAVVTLTGAELRPSRGAISDDEGRFTIRDLPAGRFVLTAMRPSFITSAYGAKRPGRPGTPVLLTAGQTQNVVVRLWRGAVVAGDVEPYAIVAGVPAHRLRYRFAAEQIEALLRVRWWEYEQDVGFPVINSPQPPGTDEAIRGAVFSDRFGSPGVGLKNEVGSDLLNFQAKIDLDVWDFEAIQDATLGPWVFLLCGGVRYVHINQKYNAARANVPPPPNTDPPLSLPTLSKAARADVLNDSHGNNVVQLVVPRATLQEVLVRPIAP